MKRQKTYSDGEYHKAMDLFESGIGLSQASNILGIPKSTLYYWRHRIYKPPTARWRPKPSSELAYVIGVLMGDGTLCRHQHKYDIELKAMDKCFTQIFSKALSKTLGKPYREPEWTGWRRGWKVYYSSKAFYTWYKKQNLKTLKPYIEHNKETVKNFLQGLYDSDGSNYRCVRVELFNSNLELLIYVKHLLKKYFNITARGPYLKTKAGTKMIIRGEEFIRKKDCYYMFISKKDDVNKFLSEIGFTIPRKQQGEPKRKR